MINVLSAHNLSDFSFRLQNPAQSSSGRGLQALPGGDQLHLSKQAHALNAAAGHNGTRPASSPALRAYQSIQSVNANPADDAGPPPGIEDRVRSAFFSQQGDDEFEASLDFDFDGRIDFADLAAVRNGATEPATRPAEPAVTIDRVRDAFFSSKGDDFDSSLDLDGDGRINFADLAVLRARSDASNTGPVQPAGEPGDNQIDPADSMRQSFFATAGHERFDERVDLNGDGRVDFADLAALRKREQATDNRPIRPADPGDEPDVEPVAANDRLRESFFAGADNARFDAGYDLNGDGRVNFADLAALRNKQDGEPARPVRPANPDEAGEH